jgi:hypothetical protein
MKEIGRGGLQDKIITSIKGQGGNAEKTNGAFKKGIADLIIKPRDFPLVLAEVKYHGRRCSHLPFKPKLEMLQKKFMREYGSICLTGAIWLGELRLYITTKDDEYVTPNETVFVPYSNGVFNMELLWRYHYRRT